MTKSEARKLFVAEIEALQADIHAVLVKLEDPCEFCGITSPEHPRGALGKPLDTNVCHDCVDAANTRILVAHEEGENDRTDPVQKVSEE
jgi:hypothetical protein